MASNSEGGVISSASPLIGHTKPFLRSISKPCKASSSSSNRNQPAESVLDHHEIDIDRGSPLQQVEKSYREHALRALVRRQVTSELKELGGVDGVAKLLATDLRTGLGAVTHQEEDEEIVSEQLKREVDLRRRLFGTNYDDVPAKQRLLREVFQSFFLSRDSIPSNLGRVCIILLVILGFIAGPVHYISRAYGPALLVIQFIIDGIALWSDCRLSQLLYEQVDNQKNVQVVKAIRWGRKRVVLVQDLVVGDLVELKSGDRIPADGLLVEGHGFEIDCDPAKGTHTCPQVSSFLACGCFVRSGLGLMLITAVGGDCKSLLPAESSCSSTVPDGVTGMEPAILHRLQKFITRVERLKLSISAMYMCVLLPFYFCGSYSSNPSGNFVKGGTPPIVVIYNVINSFYESLLFVSIVVPDTVWLAVSLSLGSFLRRMSGQRASISNLDKCELSKLGFVTTICTGKRNVLTLNKMEVHSFWIAGAHYSCYQILLSTHYSPSMSSAMPEDIWELLSEGVALNYTTGYYANKSSDSKILEESYESALEKALSRWGLDILSIDFDSVRENCTISSMEFFESTRMRSGVRTQRRGSNGKCVVHWKGAAESLLPCCSSTWLRPEAGGRAELVSLSEAPQVRENIQGIVSSMEKNGLSCVALVYCVEALGNTSVEGAAGGSDVNIKLEDGSKVASTSSACLPAGKDITLLALVGLKEPLRPETREAVKKAKDAGIRVIMATGDSVAAATAIAKESGIMEESAEVDISDKVVHASTFEAWDVSKREGKLEKLAVLARASAFHKLQLVENLQANYNYGRRELIAVTGYKLTDGPALRKADVAFSLNSGVQVPCKESSDVVLVLPDDAGFASLLEIIESARCMRYDIQHYVHFQITLSFASALTSGLRAMQLAWISLIGVLAIVALTMQRPLHSLLSGGASVPSVDEHLFTYPIMRNVALQAAYQVILFNWMINFEDQNLKDTVIFNTLIFCQVVNIVNARQSLLPKDFLFHTCWPVKVLQSLLKNELPLLTMIAGIVGVHVALFVEPLVSLFETVPLSLGHWLLCMGLALLTCFIAVVGKWLEVPPTPSLGIFST